MLEVNIPIFLLCCLNTMGAQSSPSPGSQGSHGSSSEPSSAHPCQGCQEWAGHGLGWAWPCGPSTPAAGAVEHCFYLGRKDRLNMGETGMVSSPYPACPTLILPPCLLPLLVVPGCSRVLKTTSVGCREVLMCEGRLAQTGSDRRVNTALCCRKLLF